MSDKRPRWVDQPTGQYLGHWPVGSDGPTTYTPTEQQLAQNAKAFTYHPPKGDDQTMRYTAIRAAGASLADLLVHTCPPSRELSLALTNLEQAVMWANSAIARGE